MKPVKIYVSLQTFVVSYSLRNEILVLYNL